MPIERKLKLVPPILEFFLENPPLELEVQTRGTARDIERDIPLLQELSKKTSVLVSYSIHTDRDDVKRIFEPKAPSLRAANRRLKTILRGGHRNQPVVYADSAARIRRFSLNSLRHTLPSASGSLR